MPISMNYNLLPQKSYQSILFQNANKRRMQEKLWQESHGISTALVRGCVKIQSIDKCNKRFYIQKLETSA